MAAAQERRGQADPGPPPVERVRNAPPWPKDFEVGLEAARAFAYYFGIVESDSVLTHISDIGYQVASQAGHPEYLFTFNVLDVDDPNAMALPGGFIFITQGMLDLDLSDDALAHLIGHEIAHVTEEHFSRAGRVNGLLTLLQTAALVAALVIGPDSGGGGYDYDEHTGQVRQSLGGRVAAAQGSQIFGSVFRELLVRGYGRGLEMEADRKGRRFSARSGFPMRGGAELMESLHTRIYEDQEYGYWRTHPFFADRVTAARATADVAGSPPSKAEVDAYREEMQRRMAELADSILNEDLAVFLYRTANRIAPDGSATFDIAHRGLARRVEWERKSRDILRSYTPLIAEYDELLDQIAEKPESEVRYQRVLSERDDLVEERNALYDAYSSVLEDPAAGVQHLERFLENFPDDPRARAVRFRLAQQYRWSDRADAAVLELTRILATAPPDTVAAAEEALRDFIPLTSELTTSQLLLEKSESDSVRTWATRQLTTLAASFDSLEVGSRFLDRYPDAEISDQVREKVEELAQEGYLQARLHESLQSYQAALDEYNKVILLARNTAAADRAREGIQRVQDFGR